MLSMVSFAQLEEAVNNSTMYYISAGISLTNSNNFQDSSYPSVEVGIMQENIAVGVVVGRDNLENIGRNVSFNNYWYEGKLNIYQNLGVVDGYVLAGVGNYIGTSIIFIEYGVGVSKEINGLGYYLQISNWDSTNYFTGGISFPLN